MDLLSELITTQYAFHGIIVGTVLFFALLVFVFGFKSAEEPPFDKLTDDRRAAGKKKKIKEKKIQSNGHATAVVDAGAGKRSEVKMPKKEEKEAEKSPSKEKQKQQKKSPAKNTLKENKADMENNKGGDNNKKAKGKGKENVEVTTKNKKNKTVDEKPKDFDDGEWEQALSRKDKKSRKTTLEEILPQKNEKKKDKKKVKDEEEEEEEVVKASPPEPMTSDAVQLDPLKETINAAAVEIEPVEAVAEKIQTVIIETVGASNEDKPKKQRAKKKQAPPPPESAAPGKHTASPKTATPKPDKPSKAPAPPPPVAAVEPSVDSSPPKPVRQENKKQREPSPDPVAVAATPMPQTRPIIAASQTHPLLDAVPDILEIPAAEGSNVAFDELGDTWTEAKAPKKPKKKTRKD